MCKSSERETMAIRGSEMNEPEKKPYRIADEQVPSIICRWGRCSQRQDALRIGTK
jgi:hypothetical protein